MAIPSSRQEFKDYCTSNKYSVWYFALMEKASARGWEKKTAPCYVEGHHVIPRSFGGSDLKENKVFLTSREHFIAHLLLTKMFVGDRKRKMIWAMMVLGGKGKYHRERYCTSRFYQQFKTQLTHSQSTRAKMSQHMIGKYAGDQNPMYGKRGELNPNWGRTQTLEHKQKRIQALIGRKHSSEARQKMSTNCPKNSLGKKWFHDPTTKQEKYFIPGNQPAGFIQGRLQ